MNDPMRVERPAKGRSYSIEDKAKALAVLNSNGGNVKRTARELGIPANTLRDWRNDPDSAAPVELREQKEAELESSLESIALRYAAALDDDIVVRAIIASRDPSKLAFVLGIVVDKLQLLRGKPTANISLTDWIAQHTQNQLALPEPIIEGEVASVEDI